MNAVTPYKARSACFDVYVKPQQTGWLDTRGQDGDSPYKYASQWAAMATIMSFYPIEINVCTYSLTPPGMGSLRFEWQPSKHAAV